MLANKQFSTSLASRLDSILQKKKRIPTFEKREELKKRSVADDIAQILDTEFKSDDAPSMKRSASSDAFETKPQVPNTEVNNPKWSDEDQTLISWILQNWNDAFFSNPQEARERIEYEIAQGADGLEAKTGSFQNALRFLKEKFEELSNQKKDAQISSESNDYTNTNTLELYDDPDVNHGQNFSWSEEDQSVIDWFLTNLQEGLLPSPPFKLIPGITVISSLFYNRLSLDVAAGASSPRARTGALQHDLSKLKEYVMLSKHGA